MKKRVMRKAKIQTNVDDVAKALAAVLGKDQIHRASNSMLGEPRVWIPSGVPDLDYVLDRKGRGWPGGRVIEIFGGPATCKSGIGLSLIAQSQKLGGVAALYPTEGEVDEWLAERYGVDLDKLLLPDDPEDLVAEKIFASFKRGLLAVGRNGLFVGMIDSIANMTTKAEFEEDDFDRDRAAQLRALQISKALRKLTAPIHASNSILFCINQTRDSTASVPEKPKPPGGKALKFNASVRLRLETLGKIYRTRDGKKSVGGFKLKITSEKNRLARPFQEALIILDYEKGLLPVKKK